jgi:oligoendopeptidase F
MNHISQRPEAAPRKFLPADFIVTNWDALQPYYENLTHRAIGDVATLEAWLQDVSELEAVVSEDACWRQIRMTCDTTNKELDRTAH